MFHQHLRLLWFLRMSLTSSCRVAGVRIFHAPCPEAREPNLIIRLRPVAMVVVLLVRRAFRKKDARAPRR